MSEALRLELPTAVISVVQHRLNGPLIAAAADLWIEPDDLVVDITYGRGNFWTVFRPENFVGHDLATDGVDFRHLPELDDSVNVVIFDPPYIAQGGRTTSTIPDMLDRYGLDDCPKSVVELDALHNAGIQEAARVLAPKGRLMVKCMDYVNGGKLVLGRHKIVTMAQAADLEQVDEFVHVSGCGPQPPGRRQLHSRRAHSFLCVFQAPRRRMRKVAA